MDVAVLLHGAEPGADDWHALGACDAVVSADGAGEWLRGRGMVPDVLVGDMDAITTDTLQWLETRGASVERHDARKDETDGELALAAALRMQPDRVLLFGVTGGRTAMVLANLKLLRRATEAGFDCVAVGGGERIRFLPAGAAWRLGDHAGGLLSLLASGRDARVRLTGLDWNGEVVLEGDGARGVSNPIATKDASVHVLEGAVLAIVEAP